MELNISRVSPSSEVQYVVLQNVATMSIKRRVSWTCRCISHVWQWHLKSNTASGAADSLRWFVSVRLYVPQGMFEPYLKSFYIRSTDPTQIKVLKVCFYSIVLLVQHVLYIWSVSFYWIIKKVTVVTVDGRRRRSAPSWNGVFSVSFMVLCSWRFSPIWPTKRTFPPFSESFRCSATSSLKSTFLSPVKVA